MEGKTRFLDIIRIPVKFLAFAFNSKSERIFVKQSLKKLRTLQGIALSVFFIAILTFFIIGALQMRNEVKRLHQDYPVLVSTDKFDGVILDVYHPENLRGSRSWVSFSTKNGEKRSLYVDINPEDDSSDLDDVVKPGARITKMENQDSVYVIVNNSSLNEKVYCFRLQILE